MTWTNLKETMTGPEEWKAEHSERRMTKRFDSGQQASLVTCVKTSFPVVLRLTPFPAITVTEEASYL